MLKTIAFRTKQRGWVLAGLCGYAQVDYKRLAEAVGVNRTQRMRLEFHEVEAELGYTIGGVAPFAPNGQTRVVIDTATLRHATIFCGTGRRDRTLEIAPAELVRTTAAHVAPLARKMVCEGRTTVTDHSCYAESAYGCTEDNYGNKKGVVTRTRSRTTRRVESPF